MAKYRMTCDWHTHTVFSHGKGRIEDNVRAAAEKKLRTIGIADHGPGHMLYGIERKDIQTMRDEVEQLKAIYPEMEILFGVEANIVDKSGTMDVSQDEFQLFDYVIAGYHYGVLDRSFFHTLWPAGKNLIGNRLRGAFPGQKNDNTEMIINAVVNNKLFMVTHPGSKGPIDVKAVAEACLANDTLFEISIKHTLSEEDLSTAASTGVRFVISSDAHRPEQVGSFEPAIERALRAGIDISQIVNIELV